MAAVKSTDAVHTSIEAIGLKDALKELNSLDKRARRQITKDFKEVLQPVVDYGRELIPDVDQIPSGMLRSWTPTNGRGRARNSRIFPWVPGKVKFDSRISTKRPQAYANYVKNLTVLSVYLRGAGDVVVDLAGVGTTISDKGQAMVNALNNKLGRTPSRITWRAYDAQDGNVNEGLQRVMDKVGEEIDRAKKFWKSKGYSR